MNTQRSLLALAGAVALLALAPSSVLAAAPNPPGDIPDNQAFVTYTSGAYSLKVPEGWARTQAGAATTFQDKFNVIRVEIAKAAKAPTVASATRTDVPALKKTVKQFRLVKVSSVTRAAGTAVVISYRSVSAPNAVTGKTLATDVQRYAFWRGGKLAVLTLAAPVGSDNVDPWLKVTDSFRWR
jgi:hypothetical protein